VSPDRRFEQLLAETWRVFTDQAEPELSRMPGIDRLHIAHTTGFAGGLIAAGVPERIATELAEQEIERFERDDTMRRLRAANPIPEPPA
jgi:hypothetical protein